MSNKTIIFCADGTWNGPEGDESQDSQPELITNVLKLFRRLAGVDSPGNYLLPGEKERVLVENGQTVQIAKYLHGVGDSTDIFTKLFGGAVGMGTIARIVRGYTFISRHYQSGDAIILNGFSRGAYTARALGGMIDGMGLLRPDLCTEDNKEAGYRRGIQTWLQYRRAKIDNEGILAKLGELTACMDGLFSKDLPDDSWVSVDAIAAIAVWDTVGAMGIPEYIDHGGRRDVFQFTDSKLCVKARRGLHAVSIDDLRTDFTPTLWDADPRVTQVLYSGAHADVGGGYSNTECGLSDIALLWMIDCLENQIGVVFQADPLLKPDMNALADAHDPTRNPIFAMCRQSFRQFSGATGLCVAQSVFDRFGQQVKKDPSDTVTVPYQPNLPDYLSGGKPVAGVTVVPYPHKRP